MSLTCNAEELVDASKCFSGIPKNMEMPVLIKIFCEVAGMSCTADTLVESAKCLDAIPGQMRMPVLIYLACQILTNGGTGTANTCLVCGEGAPTEDATCDCSIYYTNPPNAGVWVWDAVNSVWECIMSPGA